MNGDENLVANEEIAHNEEFLHLPQCFQKSSAAEASENVCIWKRVKLNPTYNKFNCKNKFNIISIECECSSVFRKFFNGFGANSFIAESLFLENFLSDLRNLTQSHI